MRTLVHLDKWLTNVAVAGLESSLPALAESKKLKNENLIVRVAQDLTQDARGTERDFLCKSLIETLLSISGLEPGVDRPVLAERFARYLQAHSSTELLRKFVSIHVFNVVWFRCCDLLRVEAKSNGDFVRTMEGVEHFCHRVVDMTWDAQKIKRPLTSSSANELVDRIAKRFCGA